jgi:hypothetical protein
MVTGRYSYSASKIESARRMLIAPQKSEADATSDALRECHLGLADLPTNDLGGEPSRWISTIHEIMASRVIPDDDARGAAAFRNESLDPDEKVNLSNAVSNLAAWLAGQFEGA